MIYRVLLTLVLIAMAASAADLPPQSAPPPAAVISAENPKSFDPAAATAAWLATVPRDQREKSDAYFEGGYWLILWDFLLTVAISIFLLQSRISARLRDLAERATRSRTLQVTIYGLLFVFVMAVLSFPLNVYENFFREHAYGMATQNFPAWFAEQMIGLGLALVLATVALITAYEVFRRAPRTWWLWGTGVAVLFLMIGMFLQPVYIEPLFNTYKPLNDPAIRDPILQLARANQIPVRQVFEVDASRQTNRVSANVAGFLGTTRIALNDNLLKQCSLPEIREVMGHEMGHYVLDHGAKLVMAFGIFALIGLAITRAIFDRALRRWGNRWGVRDIADPAGLPLLVLILATYAFVLTPLTNTVTRIIEREADGFGLNTAREPDASASIALKLGQYRKLDPGPIEEFIFFDHPSGRARIRMAMDWKAAQLPCGDDVDLTKKSPR